MHKKAKRDERIMATRHCELASKQVIVQLREAEMCACSGTLGSRRRGGDVCVSSSEGACALQQGESPLVPRRRLLLRKDQASEAPALVTPDTALQRSFHTERYLPWPDWQPVSCASSKGTAGVM